MSSSPEEKLAKVRLILKDLGKELAECRKILKGESP
jgi:hypothetical protein